MRKLFSNQGLALISAIVSIYVLNIFINEFFIGNGSQINMIIKEWLTHLLNI